MNNALQLPPAIRLNNEAVNLLQAGNTMEAVHCFQRALAIMKSSIVDHECNHPGVLVDRNDSPWSIPPVNATATDLDCGHIYLYNRPMLLSPDNAVEALQCNSIIRMQVVSAFIVFNLALTYHFLGIETGTDEPLQNALKLYHTVLASQSIEQCVDKETRSDLEVLMCVVMNNLSHFHYEFCEYSTSMYCMDCMAKWVSQTECLEHPSYLQEYDVEEIKLNMIFTHCPIAAHAA
jgi:hypothetical protein